MKKKKQKVFKILYRKSEYKSSVQYEVKIKAMDITEAAHKFHVANPTHFTVEEISVIEKINACVATNLHRNSNVDKIKEF